MLKNILLIVLLFATPIAQAQKFFAGVDCPVPGINSQPVSATNIVGATTNFSVTASIASSYQWQTNNGSGVYVNISNTVGHFGGTQTSLFWITNTLASDSNMQAQVVIANGCGFTTSSVVVYTVTNAPAGPAVFFPTNIPGITPIAWYEPSFGLVTNGSTVKLPNLVSGGNNIDLTNTAAQSTWPISFISAQLNNSNALAFPSQSTFLLNTIYTNSALREFFVFTAATNINSTRTIIDGFYGDAELSIDSTPQFIIRSGITIGAGGGASSTNKFTLFDIVCNNPNDIMITNDVQAVTGNSGSSRIDGFFLNGNHGIFNQGAAQTFACFVSFTNANLTTIQRSNCVYSITNRLGKWQ